MTASADRPGHDPERVAVLRARTHDALADLEAIRSSDPAAATALQVVRLTGHTLRSFWVPALDQLLGHETPRR